MKLKKVSDSIKCPECKKFGLEWWHKLYLGGNVGIMQTDIFPTEQKGRTPITGSQYIAHEFLRCRFCLAEFIEVKK